MQKLICKIFGHKWDTNAAMFIAAMALSGDKDNLFGVKECRCFRCNALFCSYNPK
jgi:hypothetical protein